MKMNSIPEVEWRKFQYANESGQKIKRRALSIFNALQRIFAAQEDIGLSFIAGEIEPVIGTINTPMNSGRVRLEWEVNEDGPVGVVVIDRQVISTTVDIEYEAVWAFTIPEYGDAYVGHRDEQINLGVNGTVEYPGNRLFELGMSVLYVLNSDKRDFD